MEAGRRIIPARAGQTWPCMPGRTSRPDHPRACGANLSAQYPDVLVFGSSPRVRGKRPRIQDHRTHQRIIPARAGQTKEYERCAESYTDHPRACGANQSVRPRFAFAVGSSPRVRGKQSTSAQRMVPRRIIPARAGQTHWRRKPPPYWQDHPRACGANSPTRRVMLSMVGSSPRVRGKRRHHRQHDRLRRIIPARAGQTAAHRCRCSPAADHPRACGANWMSSSRRRAICGSSPRVRGKLRRQCRPKIRVRIIPARAGQTKTSCVQWALT